MEEKQLSEAARVEVIQVFESMADRFMAVMIQAAQRWTMQRDDSARTTIEASSYMSTRLRKIVEELRSGS